MKRNIKKQLKDAFEPPVPLSKEAFLKTIPHPKISNRAFLLQQAHYIPKWIWGLSILAFGIAIFNTCFTQNNTLWILSAFIPFVALSAIVENNKSTTYRMAELEMSTQFSLKSVVLARLEIMGVSHLFLICLLSPLSRINGIGSILHAGVYLLVPYLLTTSLSLICTRKFHGRESIYLCMGIAVMVSTLCIMTQIEFYAFYQRKYFHWWISLFIVLSTITILEYYKKVQKTEELSWNFM